MENNNGHNEVHIYDGIVEENNAMPGWWIWLFIFTMIFGALYWLHYQVSGAPTLIDEYHVALQDYQNQVDKNLANAPADTEESLTDYMKNENAITAGAAIYAEKCSMCHGVNLEGKIGPNLTDNFWVNGKGTRMDIVHVIVKGSAAKGMPPWEGLLKANEIKNVASFVFAKIGSKPVNPKAPDGAEVK